MEIDAENNTCKLCLKKARILSTNVCDKCHAKIASHKGKPNSAHLRFSKHGMYCLKCKHVVDVDKTRVPNGSYQTYCVPCKSKIARENSVKYKPVKRIRKKSIQKKNKLVKPVEPALVEVETEKADSEEVFEWVDEVEEMDFPPNTIEVPAPTAEFAVETPRSSASEVSSPVVSPVEQPALLRSVLVAGTCQHCQCVSYFAIPTVLPPP
jgi:hypothetical protein